MDHTAIGKIVDLGRAAAEPKQIGGVNYVSVDMKPVVDVRSPRTIMLHSLVGLCEFINLYKKPGLVVVVSEDNVAYLGEENKDFIRHEYAVASLTDRDTRFEFGHFYDNEKFIIRLRSLFTKTSDQEKLIRFVSRLTVDNSLQVEDDGVSQSAVVRKGMSGALKDNEVAPSIVKLSPYRTFIEARQPESEYLFRMAETRGNTPSCALFIADGGDWRRQAISNISAYLKQNISVKEVQVIA